MLLLFNRGGVVFYIDWEIMVIFLFIVSILSATSSSFSDIFNETIFSEAGINLVSKLAIYEMMASTLDNCSSDIPLFFVTSYVFDVVAFSSIEKAIDVG